MLDIFPFNLGELVVRTAIQYQRKTDKGIHFDGYKTRKNEYTVHLELLNLCLFAFEISQVVYKRGKSTNARQFVQTSIRMFDSLRLPNSCGYVCNYLAYTVCCRSVAKNLIKFL